MITAHVNGEEWELPASTTVADVITRLTDAPRGIAVALDGAVVPKALWAATPVTAGAQLEVLTAVQGG